MIEQIIQNAEQAMKNLVIIRPPNDDCEVLINAIQRMRMNITVATLKDEPTYFDDPQLCVIILDHSNSRLLARVLRRAHSNTANPWLYTYMALTEEQLDYAFDLINEGLDDIIQLPINVTLIQNKIRATQTRFMRLIDQFIDQQKHINNLQKRLDDDQQPRYRQMVELSSEMIWMINQDGLIRYANNTAVSQLAIPLEEQRMLRCIDMVHKDDRESVLPAFERRKLGVSEQYQAKLVRADYSELWVLLSVCPIYDDDQEYDGALVMATDITQRKSIEVKLKHDALHDALTNLPNRHLLMDHLQMSIARCQRGITNFALLFMDLDRFKLLNDSMGHNAGDRLLIAVAERLLKCVRPTDTVARLGGDEFVVLLDDISEQRDAVIIAERIQTELSEPVDFEGNQIFAYASIGIVMSNSNYTEAETVLRDADNAMYRCKEYGKPYEFFNDAMHSIVVDRMELENELQIAITRKDFIIQYQPIVEIDSGIIVGVEALLRWNHPKRGILQPDVFIPVLEDSGMIVQLGYWVLEEAAKSITKWNAEIGSNRRIWVNVNLSARQFSQVDLIQQVEDIFERTRVDPKLISLELTESAVMNESDEMLDKMHYLKDKGVKLSLDDFGTGYSSFARLAYLPFDSLKMDKTFIDDIGQNKLKKFGFINSIIMLSKALGLKVVGEGIESLEQQILLIDMGCDYGQGFLFSTPVDEDDILGLLRQVSLNPMLKTLE